MDPALLCFYLHTFKKSLGTPESTANMKDVRDDSSVSPDPDPDMQTRAWIKGTGVTRIWCKKSDFQPGFAHSTLIRKGFLNTHASLNFVLGKPFTAK